MRVPSCKNAVVPAANSVDYLLSETPPAGEHEAIMAV